MTELLHTRIRRHAQARPGRTAIVWHGREISYAELQRWIDGCSALLAGLGVGRGDRVALFMQNCPQYIAAHFGIQQLGAVVCPCSPLYKEHELAWQLADLEPSALIAGDELLSVVQAAARRTPLGTLLLVHYADLLPAAPSYPAPEALHAPRAIDNAAQDFLACIEAGAPCPPLPTLASQDLAMLVYTSGTTGRPKGAMLSHASAVFKAAATIDVMGIRADDVHLAIPPLYHISGMLCGFDIPLYAGGSLVLHQRFDAESALASIERHRVTYWKGIAPMLLACMELPAGRRHDLSSLRITTATSFGVRTTPELSARWAAFSGCAATEAGYGLTETHTFDTVMPPADVRWGTVGRLLPGVRCRIVDPATGRDQPLGSPGEIALHSPANFLGYWRQPEKTLETLRDGWVFTGDLGTLDADGYLSLLGRAKEMIKVSGYSVFPEDVEELLQQHPRVERAAVLGVPHPRKGEVVQAFVLMRRDGGPVPDEAELLAWCRSNMAAYKVPQHLHFVRELPMTASGKIMRGALRELLEDPHASRRLT